MLTVINTSMMNSSRILWRRAAFALPPLPRLSLPKTISSTRSIQTTASRTFTGKQRLSPHAFIQTKSKSHSVGRWRYNSTKQSPNPTPHLGSPEPAPSLSQRLKKLSKEYGWTAVGVYLALSALDFPFCFLAVRALGTERIGQWEHAVVEFVKSIIRIPFPSLIKDAGEGTVEASEDVQASLREGTIAVDNEASKMISGADATIWTQLGLAYAIHKSFIFIRVPLTAAILPKVVKTLRGWGWNVGKNPLKPKPKP